MGRYLDKKLKWFKMIVKKSYFIASSTTNGTLECPTFIREGETVAFEIKPMHGSTYPEDISVTNAEYTYNPYSGTGGFSNPTGEVHVEFECPSLPADIIDFNITNGSYDGPNLVYKGDPEGENITIIPDSGYKLPTSVTVTNASYNYNENTGVLHIYNPVDTVTVTATCPR